VVLETAGTGYGTIEQKIYLFGDKRRTIILDVVGHLPRNDRIWASVTAIDYGEVQRGEVAKLEFYLERYDHGPLLIEAVKSSSPAVTVERIPRRQTDLWQAYMRVALESANLHGGELRESIIVKTAGTRYRDMKIPVYARIVGAVQVVPVACFLGYVRQGERKKGSVRLRSISGADFRVLELTHSLGPGWSTMLKGVTITVEYTGTRQLAIDGAIQGEVNVVVEMTRDHRRTDLEIPVIAHQSIYAKRTGPGSNVGGGDIPREPVGTISRLGTDP
jgi:hypothetical protein